MCHKVASPWAWELMDEKIWEQHLHNWKKHLRRLKGRETFKVQEDVKTSGDAEFPLCFIFLGKHSLPHYVTLVIEQARDVMKVGT